jgi:FeS assembly SUF system regulator
MLRLSKLADYAFVILAQMTREPEDNWSASSLAQITTLPLPTVAKLMKLLSRGGIVQASRGASGGYRLAKPAPEISITAIIETVDGPIQLTECAGKATGKECACAVHADCPVRTSWARLSTAVRDSLSDISLSDITVLEPS